MSKSAVPMIGRDPYLPSGGVGRLTILTAAIMVFLCVFAVALSGALLRMSERWNDDLAQTATIRLPFADSETLKQQTTAIRNALTQTQGVAGSEVLSEDATKAVLTEWIGEDINLDTVPLPTLIQVKLGSEDLDVAALQAQLSAVAPNAYFDDHSRWRGPLSLSVTILRVIALAGVLMLFTALGVLIWLSLKTSLASNSRVTSVLRQLGADDKDIERGFLSRYVGLVGIGALIGLVLGGGILMALPQPAEEGALLADLTVQGFDWIAVLLAPILAIGIAFVATKRAVAAHLKEIP